MGLVKAFSGAISGTLADQWKDIITADVFDEFSLVVSGVFIQSNNGRGSNSKSSAYVISNGSKIFVPENTAAVIFSQETIEDVVTESGGYEYRNGQDSIFNGDDYSKSIKNQITDRFGFGGQSSDNKRIVFLNLREIRGIKFGTKGPQVYHDIFYDVDLEILAFGVFSVKIINPVKFMQNFVPANVNYYSLRDNDSRNQILSEFLQLFVMSLNILSREFRISQLPSQAGNIMIDAINKQGNIEDWKNRFGLSIVSIAVENVAFSDESRKLVNDFSSQKMSIDVYNNVSQKSANISSQQKIAQGIQQNGLGDGGGTIVGMNIGKSLGTISAEDNVLTIDEQIKSVTKLKELLDLGILSQEEFTKKKNEVMNL